MADRQSNASKPRLLVVELWGLGDLVIATPFLRSAVEKFDVTLLSKPYGQELGARFWPGVKVIPFVAPWTAFRHKYRLLRWPWKDIFRLRRLVRDHFDIGLSARWDPRDHFLLLSLRTRRRLGFPRLGSEVLLTEPLERPSHTAHRYEHWRVLAGALGLASPQQAQISAAPAPLHKKILVHTGAGQPVRVWPLDRFRHLVSRLREQGYPVQVACDPDQQTWWRGVGEAQVATPRTVTELMAILDQAGAFIGNDSGPGHLAALSGVPTFTLFGPQLPSLFAPMHPAAEWLEGAPCPYKPCSDYCRFDAPGCLWDLTEASVRDQVDKFVIRHLGSPSEKISPASIRPQIQYRSPQPRRFIQVFCRYLMRGGEETSVARIASHLELAGHKVTRFWRASAEWQGVDRPPVWRQLRLAWRNQTVLGQLRELHRRWKPDAWIFHNVVPVVSLGAYSLGRELGVPIIQWVHNYRPISPSGTMCAGGKMLDPGERLLPWKEVWHGTWHGSMATAGLALAYARLHQRGDFDAVKAWMAVSEEMRQIFMQAGYPPDRFFCLHHSWDIQPPVDLSLDEGYFLFLGRMVEEKGVRFLMDLWQRPELANLPLVMAGEGPLADEYRQKTPPNVRWAGFVQGSEKRRLMAGCRALLFPCLWAEPYTTVVYEAYEQGKPVLASAMGGLKELVLDHQTGRLLEPGNIAAWAEAVLQHHNNPAPSREQGLRGLDWLRAEVSPEAWNRQFDSIISRALKQR